ncbi:ABC transporter permease [Candidatus Spongiihabitans sp.]|uniref:ABC transporter permease n=1 Tax=Candidatus Spongiihabitans sp. TaxID=3101308 RepID=UPI003C6ED301
MSFIHVWRCFNGVIKREFLRFLNQKGRFFGALVRPLVWLFIFAAGFRSILGVSIIPPYETYILYEEYITPGLLGMILLFNGMQSSLSMVYDRELGSMRILLTTPLPRWILLCCRLFASVVIALFQCAVFLIIAYLWNIQPPAIGYLSVLPAIFIGGIMLGALGLLLSSFIKQLENFAGIMNFVIFPMYFASSALYPLWKIEDVSPWLFKLCSWNPFTYVVELIRFSLYGQFSAKALIIVTVCAMIFMFLAFMGYDPKRNGNTKMERA